MEVIVLDLCVTAHTDEEWI